MKSTTRVWILVAALSISALTAAGCAAGVPFSTTPSPTAGSIQGSSVTTASIPTLEFVDPSSLAEGTNVAEGQTLAPGSYKVFMTGERIRTIQWVQSAANSDYVDLWLHFDAEGTEQFAQLTSDNINTVIPLAIGGKIIAAPEVRQAVLAGTVVISSGGTRDLRPILGPAIVPEP